MKLLTFRIIHREEVHFGTVIGNYAVPFASPSFSSRCTGILSGNTASY
ncbi:hypothetical protein WJ0W_004842 [Paenibacillus melissococcoides]|uniref:Uncharacterized protein n=1 Tax=Paenibacillus melissococcoides TaxID=2912268 RepID=A0ABM9G796_9BACL|nr:MULTISPECIES: hypothetical protein [Paenibacillus]MEB9893037.1 hypothetical protein [Bacillus cereus]CAH8247593.1 hypothetical protein WJ0W_004842 [Paenibacillus melissococcoides]CAH8705429.1 hypothetical protein HTL2_000925 [Paenibacillus melissococcoides]CAH8714859.1 hypothetical protein WDD9_004045 [Paenibacillus melissococcoides]GIO79664.1 hypothetical protein J6TS7_32740 [Paenibacillus dendritiformis]